MSDAEELAVEAASAAGAVLRDRIGSITGLRSKTAAVDFVSDVDIAAGVAAVKAIIAREPHARIIVEEPEVYDLLAIDPGSLDEERYWLIDPLDGTTSYLHTYPCYSVSIALVESEKPVAGAVFNAATGGMHSASAGAGALLDGTAIRCTTAGSVSEALLVTGFPYDRGAALDMQLRVLTGFLRAPVHGIRRDGSAALDLCHVAAGRADGFWEYTLLPWDMAAGVLICEEAGAKVTDIKGDAWTPRSGNVIAANPALHDAMLEVISAAAEEDAQGA